VVKQRFKRQAGRERAIITALGWADGDRLTFTADAGVVTARRDLGGMVTLPASTYITIPAPLRRRCGLEAGDQVLLAALPDQDTLAAYSLAVVDQAIRAHSASPHAQGDSYDRHPDIYGRVPAGRRRRGAADPRADGACPRTT
jgi:bifunctional DNA-binding transcriptional regulator/antitoxin component of YhaV-PrlF toxin-antitoxin module